MDTFTGEMRKQNEWRRHELELPNLSPISEACLAWLSISHGDGGGEMCKTVLSRVTTHELSRACHAYLLSKKFIHISEARRTSILVVTDTI